MPHPEPPSGPAEATRRSSRESTSRRRTVGAEPGAFHYADPVVTHPRWPAWARIAVLPVLMLLATFSPVLLQFVPGLQEGAAGLDESGWPIIFMGVAQLTIAPMVAILGVWLMCRFVDGMRLRDAGLRFDRRSVPAFLIGWVAMILLTGIITWATAQFGWGRTPEESGIDFARGIVYTGIGLGFVYQGFPEELVWRGYGLATLHDHPVRAAWISAAVFGVMHLASAGGQQNTFEHILYAVQAGVFGLFAAALALELRALWAAVGVHAGLHMGTFFLNSAGIEGGPLAWAGESLVLLALSLWLLRRFGRNRAETSDPQVPGASATASAKRSDPRSTRPE